VTVETLTAPPRLTPLYARALLPRLGEGRAPLPRRALRLADVRVDVDRLAAYDRVCGFLLRDTLPPTYPHVLGFPLQLALLTAPDFPLPAAGLVHVRNVITQQRDLRVDEPLTITVRAEDLAEVERGTSVDLLTEVSVADEPVWTGRSTYLARRGGDGRGGGRSPDGGSGDRRDAPPPRGAVVPVPADIGRRYAEVSGDVNPIHLHPATARLFGFRRPLAHGMWSAARLLAALDGRLPGALHVDLAFRKPLLVPATVVRVTTPADDGWHVALLSRDGRPHVDGSIRPAA